MSIAELSMEVEVDALIREPEGLYEIVDGLIKEKSVGTFAGHIGSELHLILGHFVKQARLGRTFTEVMFRTRAQPKRIRRPDIAFVSAARMPLDRPVHDAAYFSTPPDLAIEVISPNDLSVEVQEKVEEYFRADVRQIWIIHGEVGTITVYESPALARIYRRGDVLEGGDLLPGFRLVVADLLPEPPPDVPNPEGGPDVDR